MKKSDILKKIRAKRLILKISQKKLGKMIGCSNVMISKIEHGKSEIKLSHLLKMNDILNLGFFEKKYIDLE